jgi:hypothetical protein
VSWLLQADLDRELRRGAAASTTSVSKVVHTDTVETEQTRLAQAGPALINERGTTCCYAKEGAF